MRLIHALPSCNNPLTSFTAGRPSNERKLVMIPVNLLTDLQGKQWQSYAQLLTSLDWWINSLSQLLLWGLLGQSTWKLLVSFCCALCHCHRAHSKKRHNDPQEEKYGSMIPCFVTQSIQSQAIPLRHWGRGRQKALAFWSFEFKGVAGGASTNCTLQKPQVGRRGSDELLGSKS